MHTLCPVALRLKVPYDQKPCSPPGTRSFNPRRQPGKDHVTGTGYWLVSSIVWYSVCFMIEFDTDDVLCLVSSIIWYPVCFMIEFDTHDVLCLVSSIVWYSVCFICCVKISFDTWYVLCNVSRLPFWESLWLLFTRLRLAWQVYLRPAILRT